MHHPQDLWRRSRNLCPSHLNNMLLLSLELKNPYNECQKLLWRRVTCDPCEKLLMNRNPSQSSRSLPFIPEDLCTLSNGNDVILFQGLPRGWSGLYHWGIPNREWTRRHLNRTGRRRELRERSREIQKIEWFLRGLASNGTGVWVVCRLRDSGVVELLEFRRNALGSGLITIVWQRGETKVTEGSLDVRKAVRMDVHRDKFITSSARLLRITQTEILRTLLVGPWLGVLVYWRRRHGCCSRLRKAIAWMSVYWQIEEERRGYQWKTYSSVC